MKQHQRITGETTATPVWKFKKTTQREEVGFTVLANLLDINVIVAECFTREPKQVEN